MRDFGNTAISPTTPKPFAVSQPCASHPFFDSKNLNYVSVLNKGWVLGIRLSHVFIFTSEKLGLSDAREHMSATESDSVVGAILPWFVSGHHFLAVGPP